MTNCIHLVIYNVTSLCYIDLFVDWGIRATVAESEPYNFAPC